MSTNQHLPTHVRAAIAAAAQPKMPQHAAKPALPTHVQAAIAAAAQARPSSGAAPRAPARHVQAAISAAVQPKPKLPASNVPPHHVQAMITAAAQPKGLSAPSPSPSPVQMSGVPRSPDQTTRVPASARGVLQPSKIRRRKKRSRVDYFDLWDDVFPTPEDKDPYLVGNRRQHLMGSTPNKTSGTGRALLERWENKDEAKARYLGEETGSAKYKDLENWEVLIRKSVNGRREWVGLTATYTSKNGNPKTAIHMGHKLAAAEYYKRGAQVFANRKQRYQERYRDYMKPGRSSEERLRKAFMREPENYRFEWYSVNTSQGSGGFTYQ